MTFKHFCSLILSVFVALNSFAQEEVLFTIDEKPVYSSDFKRVYLKNLELVKDETQKDVDEYLKLFTNYKLKLKEAEALKLDNKPVFKREFDNYRRQLLKNYIYDTKVTDALVEEAYERLKTEIDASHILVRLREDASQEDIDKALTEIKKIRQEAIDGDFDAVKNRVGNGRTIIAEDLGYFTAFRMVYDFENAAYATNKGEISEPVKTRFGYHIIKVKDKRPALGEVKVAHIMIDVKDDEANNEDAKKRIDDLYKRIQQGEDFSALAKQFSEDKSSASKGGELDKFSSGKLSSQVFEKKAFDLKNVGDVSEPFKTKFGWHILKLKEKEGLEDYKKLKPELEQRIRRDSRSRVINKSRVENLKKDYNLTFDNPNLDYFIGIINDDFRKGTWQFPTNFKADKPFVKIKERQLTYKDFGEELLRSQRGRSKKLSNEALVKEVYKNFLTQEMYKYQEDNLEKNNKEFSQIIQEFRDGLLIFDVMETEIWSKAKKDSVNLNKYYDTNKSNYYLDQRVDATIASSISKKDVKKVAKLLKTNTSIEEIKRILNTNNKVSVTFAEGEYEKNDQALPKGLNIQEGVSKVIKHNKAYTVVKINKVLPREQQSFEDAKGKIISDYQTYLEQQWLKQLSNKYKINVDESVLKKVKTQLKS